MIVGHLDKLAEESRLWPAAIKRGLEYLRNNDLSALEKGKHVIDGEALFVMIDQYENQPKANRRPEAHRLYLDIQYIIAGEEIIGWDLLSGNSAIDEDLSAGKDLIFYKPGENETDIVMTAGMYAVFFPWDVHRPCCQRQSASVVKKAVVKIKMDQL